MASPLSEMCLICGGPPRAPHSGDFPDEDEDESESESESESQSKAKRLRGLSFEGLEWLGDNVGINEAEELITLGLHNYYGMFDLDYDASVYFSGATMFRCTKPWPEGDPYGLTCHEKCYRLLEKDLQYTLRFHDVWPLVMQEDDWWKWMGFGDLLPYLDNDYEGFRFKQLYLDGKEWMFHDPTTDRENAERILKVWRPIVEQIKTKEHGQDGSQAGNEADSKTATQDGSSQAGNEANSETATQDGSQAGIEAASKTATQDGSQAGNEAASKTATQDGFQTGNEANSETAKDSVDKSDA